MSAIASAIVAKVAKAALSYARSWAKKDCRVRGKWAGTYTTTPATKEEAERTGYSDWKKCVRVTVDSRDPLRFIHESGAEWAIGSGLISDGGSIPSWAQMTLGRWLDLKPYSEKKKLGFFLHDEGYHNGGIWMRPTADSPWQFVPCTRAMVDMLLFQSMAGTNADKRLIYEAVKSPFGRRSWNRCQRLIKANLTKRQQPKEIP